ncbi:DUF2309 domain-containing protein [Rubripirellula reticaptiva]|uniref:Probable inorganic carbon transporter subunit DabA n=1 Tax=Rubripirellula reticaptiva TaxID=2528013 RepID=A0A5C6F2I7_9BACT|nr:DUF2309 domain-containing protein [Rubripirellula reticaptiva]TWU55335.1 hypothetical protein Poly59_16320 [Rubripirellula reticaptiva]
MSTAQATAHETFVPPAYDSPHVARQISDLIAEVSEVIAPVWPLKDYVAVNPYAGISHRSFMDARAFLKVFSDCETLMPLEHYAAEFHQGNFTIADIESAITELSTSGVSQPLTAVQVVENLRAIGWVGVIATTQDQPAVKPNHDRPIRTIAEYASNALDVDWTEAIVEEVSKYCSTHYDQSQATWSSPNKHLPLYQAWRTAAEHDRNIEILGLSGFRKYVASMPHTPEAAIVFSLNQLGVPQPLWSTFLLCQAFSIPGWSAWAKYQSSWQDAECVENNDLSGLLAIRLAYDAALSKAKSLSLNWTSLVDNGSASFKSEWTSPGDDSMLRYTLLRAGEIAYRDGLLDSLAISNSQTAETNDCKLAQMVFCIDVRSERIRRQLETQSSDVETFGFAGFFGMGFDFAKLGQSCGNSHLPVLLKPQFKVHEGIKDSGTANEAQAIADRSQTRSWRKLWKNFQTSAVGCFSFVETTGLLYGFKLLGRSIGYTPWSVNASVDGVAIQDRKKVGPTLRGLHEQGITPSLLADMAEGMLRNLGLTKDFAKLVVFCGHACQTENNPLAAGLDCGACGGHSGEPNARFAALLLNQPDIREALAERGIAIPKGTYFLGALHNTTTDSIEFFDVDEVPGTLQSDVQELTNSCVAATKQTQAERLPHLASSSLADLIGRASDWSEVRPEWGLAGNAAFIVAPRWVTKNSNLDARAFLHSYDHTQDEGGKVLETIMTAPMIVANWINMQYYGSTVDNHHFGSGNKTIHNVVGGFGILSGNGGDLMTGLPWQSLHTGDRYQHLPMRLQVVIAAPLDMIERVIAKHEMVSNLLDGGWLQLVAITDGRTYRYCKGANWQQLDEANAASLPAK